MSKYGLLATPYCEEEQIAKVARSYGWKVTGQQVHKDALKKVYICQILGHDVRLKGSCAGYGPDRLWRRTLGCSGRGPPGRSTPIIPPKTALL